LLLIFFFLFILYCAEFFWDIALSPVVYSRSISEYIKSSYLSDGLAGMCIFLCVVWVCVYVSIYISNDECEQNESFCQAGNPSIWQEQCHVCLPGGKPCVKVWSDWRSQLLIVYAFCVTPFLCTFPFSLLALCIVCLIHSSSPPT
jgi:hypothetical protein